jgi:hypothetical protein
MLNTDFYPTYDKMTVHDSISSLKIESGVLLFVACLLKPTEVLPQMLHVTHVLPVALIEHEDNESVSE